MARQNFRRLVLRTPITIPVEIEFPLVSLPDIQLPLKIKVGEAIFDVNLELKFIERQTVGT